MRNRLRHAALTLAVLATAGASVSAAAQCRPPRDSHEAKLLAFYSVPLVFSADPAALGDVPGSVRLGVEGAYVPGASASLSHTEFCYTGRAEHTSLTHVFGRPRLAVGLPYGVVAELSYLPPVTIAGATPTLVSGALSLRREVMPSLALTARVHGTTGIVRGAITCPREALQQNQPEAPCYGTAPSRDEFRPDMAGAELLADNGVDAASRRVRLVAGVGVNALRPRFRVGFSDLFGGTDRTSITVNLTRVTALAGAAIPLTRRCDASAAAYASFGDVATVRAGLGCALRLP